MRKKKANNIVIECKPLTHKEFTKQLKKASKEKIDPNPLQTFYIVSKVMVNTMMKIIDNTIKYHQTLKAFGKMYKEAIKRKNV